MNKGRLIQNVFVAVLIFSIAIFLINCGGGDGDGAVADGGDGGGGVANESIAGIWEGTFISEVTSQVYEVIGIISENRETRFISDWGGQYSGTVNISGNNVSGILRAYAPVGFTFPDGSSVGDVSMTGNFQEKVLINGTYTGVGDRGSFTLTYNALYERDSSLDLLSGIWTESDSGYTLNVNIDTNGSLLGNDSEGCVFTGSVSIINSDYNAYRVSFTASSCGIYNGTYNGLASLYDTSEINDTLVYGVSNVNFSIVGSLTPTPTLPPIYIVTGYWEFNYHVVSPVGEGWDMGPYYFTLSQSGNNITGTVIFGMDQCLGEEAPITGTIYGTDITMSFIDMCDGVAIPMKGTVVDISHMKGTYEKGDWFGPWWADRIYEIPDY